MKENLGESEISLGKIGKNLGKSWDIPGKPQENQEKPLENREKPWENWEFPQETLRKMGNSQPIPNLGNNLGILVQGQTMDDIPKEVLSDCAHLVKANSIQGNPGKSWEFLGKSRNTLGNPQENSGKTLENPRKSPGKFWEIPADPQERVRKSPGKGWDPSPESQKIPGKGSWETIP